MWSDWGDQGVYRIVREFMMGQDNLLLVLKRQGPSTGAEYPLKGANASLARARAWKD